MAQASVKFVPTADMVKFYMSKDAVQLAQEMIAAGRYEQGPTIEDVVAGVDGAEEAFDLSNNPFRMPERHVRYGKGRSVSVGDIVTVDGVSYLCDSCGWTQLAG